MSQVDPVDIFVVGGGINGCGIARDAAGRGYSVHLVEMDDLASGTSSWSTKLVHGGLRYLEHYEFRLVREALMEREVLWEMAPHIIRPLRFVLPHSAGMRPAWLLRLGLFLYDHIGGRRRLPPTRTLDMRSDAAGRPLKPVFSRGFEYSDCWVDDARLVVLNARDAADRGAVIQTRAQLVSARPEGELWRLAVEHGLTGRRSEVRARLLVNAAGPWVDRVLSSALGREGPHNVRLVKGSHIVVRRLFDHDRCYIFQHPDGRVVFAIPYEKDFTLIGTTDLDYEGEPKDAAISPEETDYLCAAASEYFAEPIVPGDVVWSYCGVRPLYDDGASKAQEATRDYVLKRDRARGAPPLVNIFGGKITTYRRLAEAMMETVEGLIGRKGEAWTKGTRLPGGDFDAEDFAGETARLKARYPFLADLYAERLVRLYGTRAARILGEARRSTALGRHFGADLYEAEVAYLMNEEWALAAEDVLWRRTKRGLQLDAEEVAALDAHMAGRREEIRRAAAE